MQKGKEIANWVCGNIGLSRLEYQHGDRMWLLRARSGIQDIFKDCLRIRPDFKLPGVSPSP